MHKLNTRAGEGVGVGHFPSDSLESQSYDFGKIAHIRPLYGVERHHKSFSNREEYLRKSEKSKIGPKFFGFFSQISVIRL